MIEIKDLRAGYGGDEVISGLDLKLETGESLGIIGPNGCGKTTLLRCIAGVLPFKGTVMLDGKGIKSLGGKALAKKVGMMSQMSSVSFGYTVMDTVLMGRFAHSGGMFSPISQKDREIASEALSTVGLVKEAQRRVDELSGGQLQRVFLAKLIAQDPDIILLDEPTNHLDLSYQVELIDFLRDWSRNKNKSLIGVLHDLNLALRLFPKLMLMDNGQIAVLGKGSEVLASELLNSAYRMDVGQYMRESLGLWQKI